MNDYPDTVVDRLWLIFIGVLIIVSLFLLSFVVSSIKSDSVEAKGSTPSYSKSSSDMYDSPNIITNGMAAVSDGLSHTMSSTALAIDNAAQSVASATAQSGKTVGHGVQIGVTNVAHGVGSSLGFVGNTVGSGVGFVGNTLGSGVGFVFSIPSNVLGFVANTSVVNVVIRPSNHVEVPIIDPKSPELLAALDALPAEEAATKTTQQNSSGSAWPIHGKITTAFGVAHWPYQPTHTGLDISDGLRGGGTPIKPFRSGRVIDVIHENYSLGNHIIIDHGSGVTSVYGHLASTSVAVGQEVNLSTTIGLEGSTGASTGAHLHFEIRVNGQATDPSQFISGQP